MKLYSSNDFYKLYQGNMLDMLKVIEKESIDSIVCDPPYELNFMGKGWDNSGIAFNKDTWEQCYEVLKPGGYLLAFGGSRTYHRIACAIEDAGFEIRDTIMWLYGSGFPKSMDISKSLDKRNGRVNNDFIKFGKYLKEKRGNISQTEIRKLFPSKNGTPTGNVSNWELGKNVPIMEQYKILKEKLDLDDSYDWLIEREEAEREIIGQRESTAMDGYKWLGEKYEKSQKKLIDITIPSTDLAKQWQGWGTTLKPSFEPIIVARKPFKGSCIDNVIKYGVGGINIDECRVESDEKRTIPINAEEIEIKENGSHLDSLHKNQQHECVENNLGRFPANTILTYDETDFEEVCGGFPNTKGFYRPNCKDKSYSQSGNIKFGGGNVSSQYNDIGSAARYFYCAKASKKDRDEGLEEFEATTDNAKGNGLDRVCEYCGVSQLTSEKCLCETKSWITKPKKNTHPTVKPTQLMQYLVRLVTPNGGTILDPFNGSGSTGKAVMYENKERNKNYKYIGIELTEEYLPISKARIEYVCRESNNNEKQLELNDILDEL